MTMALAALSLLMQRHSSRLASLLSLVPFLYGLLTSMV